MRMVGWRNVMIVLVTGGSGSGKSEYAEQLVMRFGDCRRFYVATMEVFGEEGREKVLRHKRLRRGKGFVTLERQRNVGGLELHGTGERAVLLECVSNLAANEMFGGGETEEAGQGGQELQINRAEQESQEKDISPPQADQLADRIFGGICRLSRQADHMVIVTNEVGADGTAYDPYTMEYIRLMGLLNQRLARMADRVVEVVYGIPVVLKNSNARKDLANDFSCIARKSLEDRL